MCTRIICRMEKDLLCVNIGKKGLSESVVAEIRMLLEKKRLIKVRFLKSAGSDRKGLVEKLGDLTGGVVERSTGFVCVLRKKGVSSCIK